MSPQVIDYTLKSENQTQKLPFVWIILSNHIPRNVSKIYTFIFLALMTVLSLADKMLIIRLGRLLHFEQTKTSKFL